MNEGIYKQCKAEQLTPPYDVYGEIIGVEALYQLTKNFGGTSMYIPRTRFLFRKHVNNKIREEFDGDNYKEIARKYGVCERTVRNILKKQLHN